MELNILHEDILENDCEAIILSIDGLNKGMEGNLARKFERKYPELWSQIQSVMKYPLAIGEIFSYRPEVDPKYKLVIVASTLNHLENLSREDREDIVYTTFKKALRSALKYKIKRIAVAPMTGGWRLDTMNAFIAMSNGIEDVLKGDNDIDIDIFVHDENEHKKLLNLAKSMGW